VAEANIEYYKSLATPEQPAKKPTQKPRVKPEVPAEEVDDLPPPPPPPLDY
jgi:hypothetical protein